MPELQQISSNEHEKNIKEASQTQIDNSKSMGWDYAGEGVFIKDNFIGWFENRNFIKELL